MAILKRMILVVCLMGVTVFASSCVPVSHTSDEGLGGEGSGGRGGHGGR